MTSVSTAQEAPRWPNLTESDFFLRDFHFASGESLPELRLHYTTLGTPKRNTAGKIINGVLMLHGSGGSGKLWLSPGLGGELFGAGQPVDLTQYFVILPDGIGRGRSSKPSDGLRGKFPHYRSIDIITAEYRLLTEHLDVAHLRLVIGGSMGGMHTWLYGQMYPDLMDGIVPLASQPTPISGRNWLTRRGGIEAIRNDPDWKDGNYEKNPTRFAATEPMLLLMTASVEELQRKAPTREEGDAYYRRLVEETRKYDANDLLWATEAIMDYNPSNDDIRRIKAHVLAINFEDDEVNPVQLNVILPAIKDIPNANLIIVPRSPETIGHFTYQHAEFWKKYLADFMKKLPAAE